MPASVLFEYGETTLTLPPPAKITSATMRVQSGQETAGGVAVVSDSGLAREYVSLNFESLTSAEADSLRDFFHNTCVGRLHEFSCTLPGKASAPARFRDSELIFEQVADNVHDVGLKLELR